MYFQMRAARANDRRLVLAGLAPSRLVAARMATGLAVALLAAASALVALELRTGISNPGRVLAGTLMFAVIYLAIGALIGVLVANPVNGVVLVLFVWILDVFFGPAIGATDRPVTRVSVIPPSLSAWRPRLSGGRDDEGRLSCRHGNHRAHRPSRRPLRFRGPRHAEDRRRTGREPRRPRSRGQLMTTAQRDISLGTVEVAC